ncbi:MAG: hypothetical protein R2838_22015 [Caldilineaceae bacterium]
MTPVPSTSSSPNPPSACPSTAGSRRPISSPRSTRGQANQAAGRTSIPLRLCAGQGAAARSPGWTRPSGRSLVHGAVQRSELYRRAGIAQPDAIYADDAGTRHRGRAMVIAASRRPAAWTAGCASSAHASRRSPRGG